MPFFYQEPGSNGFAAISTTDWSKLNCRINFDELIVRDDDEYFYVFMYATVCDDILFYKDKSVDRNWEFKPQKLILKSAKKESDRIKHSQCQKLFHKIFAELSQDKFYQGDMQILDSNIVNMLLSGTDNQGRDLGGVYDSLLTSFWNAAETQPEKLALDEIKIPQRSNKGGYSSPKQSEYEMLKDREKFLLEQVGCASIHELVLLLQQGNEVSGNVAAILDIARMLYQ